MTGEYISYLYKERYLDYQTLLDEVRYIPETGIFIGNKNWGRRKKGHETGTFHSGGYRTVSIKGISYMAHRLAWFYIYKEWPKGDIDHIDGNRANNAIDNLRDVNRSENNFNQRGASKNNKSGLLGVSFHKHSGLYRATIYVKYKQTCIGYYKTPEEAHQAYLETKRKIHSTCTI